MYGLSSAAAATHVGLFNRAPETYAIYETSVSERHIFEDPVSESSTSAAVLVAESLEQLIDREIDATRPMHSIISEEANLDSLQTWRATTKAKRVLYLSSPAIVIDPLESSIYKRNGVNGRVHLLQTANPEQRI